MPTLSVWFLSSIHRSRVHECAYIVFDPFVCLDAVSHRRNTLPLAHLWRCGCDATVSASQPQRCAIIGDCRKIQTHNDRIASHRHQQHKFENKAHSHSHSLRYSAIRLNPITCAVCCAFEISSIEVVVVVVVWFAVVVAAGSVGAVSAQHRQHKHRFVVH